MRIRKFNEDLSNEIDFVYIAQCFSDFTDVDIADIRENVTGSGTKWVSITISPKPSDEKETNWYCASLNVKPDNFLKNRTEVMSGETGLDRYMQEINKMSLILEKIHSSLEKIKIEYTDYEINFEILTSMYISIFPPKSI